MPRSEPATILAVLLLLPLVGAGCRATGGASSGGAGGEDAEERADELRDKRREVELKRLELNLARIDGENDLANARDDLAEAALALTEAQQALALFREKERALALGDAENDLAGTRQRVIEERADLEQVVRSYEQDDYADGIEEIVLSRHRARLELAERGLAIQEAQFSLLGEHELPRKERALVEELAAAQRAHREAEHALAHQKLEARMTLMRLEHELDALREELDELEPGSGGPRSAIEEDDAGDPPLEPKEPQSPDSLTEGT